MQIPGLWFVLLHLPIFPQTDAGAFAGVFSVVALACRSLEEWALGYKKGFFSRIKGWMQNPDPLHHISFHPWDPSAFLQHSRIITIK